MKIRYIILSIIVTAGYFIVSSCGVEYKLTNAKLDYSIYKTIAVGDFPNQAPLVYPSLYQEFNEKLKNAYTRQTRLQMVPQNGDYNVGGSDGLAAQTRLIMTVRVIFSNSKNSQEDFDRNFTAQKEFPATTSFESVQGQLVSELVDEIVDQIFNATVASW